MKRPRFSLRWLMMLVAIVAVGIGGEMMLSRWVEYHRLAATHARAESTFRAWSDANRRDRREEVRSIVLMYDALADQHATKRAEYERAAWRPWMSTEKRETIVTSEH